MSGNRLVRVLWWALAIPPVALALAFASVLSGVGPAREGFWRIDTITVTEAAALRDPAALFQHVRAGADLNRRYPVRPRVLGGEETSATPLEAATATGHAEIVSLLLEWGARPDADQLAVVFCLAERSRAPEIVHLLEQRSGVHPPADCGRVRLPF